MVPLRHAAFPIFRAAALARDEDADHLGETNPGTLVLACWLKGYSVSCRVGDLLPESFTWRRDFCLGRGSRE